MLLLPQWWQDTVVPSSLAELAGFARQHSTAPGAASPAGELLPIPSTPALPLAAGCPSRSSPPFPARQSGQLFPLSLCPLGHFVSETSTNTNKAICKTNVLSLLVSIYRPLNQKSKKTSHFIGFPSPQCSPQSPGLQKAFFSNKVFLGSNPALAPQGH